MPNPKPPRKTELLDMGSRALREYQEAERRRAAWAEQAALKEQLVETGRVSRTSRR